MHIGAVASARVVGQGRRWRFCRRPWPSPLLPVVAVAGDRLVLQHGRPLAVTGGVMRQSSITGYNPAGAYRVTTRELGLAVRDRHRLTQLVYQRPLARRLSGFAAAAHHRNWSHRRGLSNNLVMLGVSLAH